MFEGEMTKSRMPIRSRKTEKPSDILRSDLCSPISTNALDWSRYYVSFIDEHSGFVAVVPIKQKSDVRKELEAFISLAQRQYCIVLKEVFSDGGG